MTGGSPYVPHSADETDAMLDAVGVDDVEALFDVPEAVRFEGGWRTCHRVVVSAGPVTTVGFRAGRRRR